MAKHMQTILIDDLDGTEITKGETITFAYRGAEYRIDLTTRTPRSSTRRWTSTSSTPAAWVAGASPGAVGTARVGTRPT